MLNIIVEISKQLFSDEISQITSSLGNPKLAISAFDVPISNLFNEELNTIFGVGVFIGIFNHIGNSSIDSSSNTPFTIHVASLSNSEKLESLGQEVAALEIKLGFHNDGLLTSNTIEIPKHIGLYNIYISYLNPGNFIWVPMALWDELSKYRLELIKKKEVVIKTKLTPFLYTRQNNAKKFSSYQYVTAPLCIINDTGEERFFLNGQVRLDENPPEYVNLVNTIRESLQQNDKKIYIPQKERRGIVLKNTLGFHARDMFQNPTEGVDLSRVLIRTVDVNAELYPSIKIE